MSGKANFKVDTKLAALLGESYRSTELALKELVDNAWDADAENVWITLPEPLTKDPIVIRDDGLGMTDREIKSGYLKIASDRRTRKGERTVKFNRLVKGRKGIGKFAGLVSANQMDIETSARGKKTHLTIKKGDLLASEKDLEKVDLPFNVEETAAEAHGSTVTLSDLSQNLSFPDPDKLKQLLFLEYGRDARFNIYVNEETLDVEDLPGETVTEEVTLPDVGEVKMKFTITEDRPPRQSGIAVRVDSKIIGRPHFFGLDQTDEIPAKYFKRVYGEVEANGLSEDVTADWGAIIENSLAYERLRSYVQPRLYRALQDKYKKELNRTRARWDRNIRGKVRQLPEEFRPQALKALEKVINKFYDQPEERIESVMEVVLDIIQGDY